MFFANYPPRHMKNTINSIQTVNYTQSKHPVSSPLPLQVTTHHKHTLPRVFQHVAPPREAGAGIFVCHFDPLPPMSNHPLFCPNLHVHYPSDPSPPPLPLQVTTHHKHTLPRVFQHVAPPREAGAGIFVCHFDPLPPMSNHPLFCPNLHVHYPSDPPPPPLPLQVTTHHKHTLPRVFQHVAPPREAGAGIFVCHFGTSTP